MKRPVADAEQPTRYQQFVNEAYARSQTVGHGCSRAHVNQGRITRRGVHLTCCGGSSALCKFDDIDWLLEKVREMGNEVDFLRQQLDAPVKQPRVEQAPMVINNFIFGDSAINHLAKIAPAILNQFANGVSLALLCEQALSQAPASADKDRLLALKDSAEPIDQLNYKREVVEILEEYVTELPVDKRSQVKQQLVGIHDSIDAAAEQLGIPIID